MTSKKSKRIIAVFFLLLIINSAITPTVSYALTAGPTAPEATSFEPVDTSDLVNTISGDFVYNLPLLEVPGPSGGYPFSLSYHAGIQPNEEASWVGLGFTLNPGAITRNVNGYPDDHKNVMDVDHAYWEGGERTTHNVGISYGLANTPASVNFGLSFSQDTYQGFGVGWQAGFGTTNGPINFGVSFGENGNRNFGASVSLQAGVGSSQGGTAVGVSYDGSKLNGSLSVSGGVGASISSEGGHSFSVGKTNLGISSVHNAKAGSVNTKQSGFGIDIPVYAGVNISLGYSYLRYWSDETATVKTNGSLYYPKAPLANFDLNAFDTYSILRTNSNLALDPMPVKQLGGTFPNYDNYYVTAQGLSGSIRPFIYKGLMFRQNIKKNDVYEVKQYAYAAAEYRTDNVEFRFLNDFSNKYLYDQGKIEEGTLPLNAVFDGVEETGKQNNDGINDNHLAGSKHIEWYTNSQILSMEPTKIAKNDGFVDYSLSNWNRSSLPLDQIGGFMITNESGVTYHYALPVYSWDEIIYSENVNKAQGTTFNKLSKPTRYAYQWLLTSVTGPDYVDPNLNGKADAGDWGYWVDFTYEKFSSDFKWRNPSQDFHIDLDNNFKNYSSGSKEVYYLKTIKTETHVAVFNKSVRVDGREVTDSKNGGFLPKAIYQEHPDIQECIDACPTNDPTESCITTCENTYPDVISGYDYPESSLKLDNIKLYKVDDFYANRLTDEFTQRSIVFEHDYRLASETPNSYDNSSPEVKLGKLTLLSVKFLGKKGVGLIPPIEFEYDISDFVGASAYINDVYEGYSQINSHPTSQAVRDKLNEGDIIRFQQDGLVKYGLILSKDDDNIRIISLGQNGLTEGTISEINKTKNPPYAHDKSDIWNMYKSNGFKSISELDENYGRFVDAISAKATDAWSLRKVINSLGSILEVEYESDDYQKIVLNSKYQFALAHAYAESNECFLRLEGTSSVKNVFKLGQQINLLLLINDQSECTTFMPEIFEGTVEVAAFDEENNVVKVTSLSGNPAGLLVTSACGAQPRNNFIAGHVGTESPFMYGGGIRVKNLKYVAGNSTNITSYSYKDESNQSSGVTSYEPYSFGASIKRRADYKWKNFYDYSEGNSYNDNAYNERLYDGCSQLLAIAKELPAPGVMYKVVTVKNSIIHSDGHKQDIPNFSTYEFHLFEENMVKVNVLKPATEINAADGTYDGSPYNGTFSKDIVLEDYTSKIGSLKKITSFNKVGTITTKVAETVFGYLDEEVGETSYMDKLGSFNHQGVINETFMDIRFIHRNLSGLVTRRHQFPTVKLYESRTDFLTGIKTKSKNIGFDFYSGILTQHETSDSYGNIYRSNSIPAYEKYPEMGLKIDNIHNKNMLSQVTASETRLVNSQNQISGLLSASVQTWSKQVPVLNQSETSNVWRTQSAYQWNGVQELNSDGSYKISEFELNPFNWTNLEANDLWQKHSESTLYDIYSHNLEARDVNGNFACVRKDNKQQLVIASISNASYNETAYSGMEYSSGAPDKEGGVDPGSGNASRAFAHTGEFSLRLGSGLQGFNYNLTASPVVDLSKKYRASVWVRTPGLTETQAELGQIEFFYIANGQEIKIHPMLNNNKSKAWYQLTLDVDPSGASSVQIGVRNNSSREVYFDDFRVHPLNASMRAFVYDHFSGELNYILDGNNFYSKFEYDAMGRLIRTSRELLNFDFGTGKESFRADAILKEFRYNYGKE